MEASDRRGQREPVGAHTLGFVELLELCPHRRVVSRYSLGDSLHHGFTVFFGWLPALLGALAILLIGYVVAKVVSRLVARLTRRAGLDRALHGGPGGTVVSRAVPEPSGLLGTLTFWALFLAAVSLAATALGIEALTAFIAPCSLTCRT